MKHGEKTCDMWQVTRDMNHQLPTVNDPPSFTHHASRITHHIVSPVTRHPSLVTCLSLIVLVSTNSTRAVTTATDPQGNPYQAIVGRNVFSLKPPPPLPNPEDLIKKVPPPKIKLQGLTTILGRRQVLCKVLMPAKPPERPQPQEVSFVMSEGERQGEIEVLEINEQVGTVKFKNHEEVQLLNMKDDADKPLVTALPPGLPPGALLGAPPGALPGVPPQTAAFNPSAPGTITTIGSRIPPRPLRASTPVDGVAAGTGIAPQTTQVAAPLSIEEQEVLIEVKRKYYQDTGHPNAAIMPPTSLTPPKEGTTPP
jgi:hypothetical protein